MKMDPLVLYLSRDVFGSLHRHLLRPGSTVEEAAFLYVSVSARPDGGSGIRLIESELLQPSAFSHRTPRYLELKDETRARVIKHAHDLGASLVEIHSHPLFDPVFSASDEAGLRQFVPHVWWRLKGRPYGAIVIAPKGFDALFWVDNPKTPVTLSRIDVDGTQLTPTGISLRNWEDHNDE